MISKLVNRHDFPFMGEHHETKDRICNSSHGIHITSSEEKVIVQLSVDDLYVDQYCLPG